MTISDAIGTLHTLKGMHVSAKEKLVEIARGREIVVAKSISDEEIKGAIRSEI